MSVCNCGHGERFHSDRGCKAHADYIPCCCRRFDPREWYERYDTDEWGMLIDPAAYERIGSLRQIDESLLKLTGHQRHRPIMDVHLPGE